MEYTDYLTDNFTWGEFWSNSLSGKRIEPPQEYYDNIFKVATELQKIRDIVDRPIRVNSGWRSVQWNKVIGGSSKSMHLTGEGADISCYIPIDQLVFYAGRETIFKGIGIANKFLHLDTRKKVTFWYY